MKRSPSPTFALCVALAIASSSGVMAATVHHRHVYYSPYRFYGPCQVFHYQVVEIRNFRLTRAYLQPRGYCGLPHQADPAGANDTGSLNQIH